MFTKGNTGREPCAPEASPPGSPDHWYMNFQIHLPVVWGGLGRREKASGRASREVHLKGNDRDPIPKGTIGTPKGSKREY